MAAKASQCLQFSVSIASERTVRKKDFSLQFPPRCKEERFPVLISCSLHPRKSATYHRSVAQKLSCSPQNYEGSVAVMNFFSVRLIQLLSYYKFIDSCCTFKVFSLDVMMVNQLTTQFTPFKQ